jgi:hypothetical protein
MSKKEIATAAETALSVNHNMFAEDSGAGMEGASAESFAIPFITILQKGSPQVDEASGVAIDGAKGGMIYDNVYGQITDGKAGITIVPCAYRRVFIRWGARGTEGGGFKGELTPEAVAAMREAGSVVEVDGKLMVPMSDGTINEKKCDRISDTRNHYVLVVDNETGSWKEALLSLTSTQIRKSKMLMSMLSGVKMKGAAGMFTPPTFANRVKLTTLGESNDKGTWFGVKFELDGTVDRAEVYAAAKAFHASVAKGGVIAKYEDAGEGATQAAGF